MAWHRISCRIARERRLQKTILQAHTACLFPKKREKSFGSQFMTNRTRRSRPHCSFHPAMRKSISTLGAWFHIVNACVIWVFPLFGEALKNWGKPATLLSSLLRRGQVNANNAAAAAAGWTRHYVHQ
jgi:hypothetical protein